MTGSTYTDMVTLFDGNCTGCHSAASKLGGLDLETDPCAALVGVSSGYGDPLVDPGNADGSVLFGKVSDSGAYGGVMPQGGALDSASVEAVRSWIDGGASCATGGADSGGSDGGGAAGFTFARVQDEILTPQCAVCHAPGADPDAEYLDLSEGAAYDNIVRVAAGWDASLYRVTPGNPETSFLYMKVRNTIAEDGSQGEPMPEGAPNGLDDTEKLTLLYGWILEGANP